MSEGPQTERLTDPELPGPGGTGGRWGVDSKQSHASAYSDNHDEPQEGDTGPSDSSETPRHRSGPVPHPLGGVRGPSDRLPGGTLAPVTVTEPPRGARPAPTQGDTQVGRKLLPGDVAVLFLGGDAGCQAGTPLQSAWSPLRPTHSRDTAHLQLLGLFSV